MNKAPLILTIVGAVFVLLSLAALAISLLIPIINAPNASWDEAMLGIVPSGGCSCCSILIVLAGVIWLVMARKR
jgi:hypothetical protein